MNADVLPVTGIRKARPFPAKTFSEVRNGMETVSILEVVETHGLCRETIRKNYLEKPAIIFPLRSKGKLHAFKEHGGSSNSTNEGKCYNEFDETLTLSFL